MKKFLRLLPVSLLILLIISLGLAVFSCQPAAHASGLLPPSGTNCQGVQTGNCGDYTLDDFLRLTIRIIQFIWGIAGGLALLFFIYGGFIFLTSAGNTERVAKGKQTVVNSLIGLIVIFASWAIINFVFKSLGINANWNTPGWWPLT